ncbi:hypothetical protein ABEB36_004393 [Hypothenemus hampei]|uniref:UDP-glucuronosyltransferase n=1 Tax=Hypothenemus hampei TaxID=57062 RepID=A0ABD1F371_HYPHA
MLARIVVVWCVVSTLMQLADCYNVLVVFGHPGKSHYDVFKPLFQELGERGHNITIISHVKTQGDIQNVRDVLLSDQPVVNVLNMSSFTGSWIQKFLEAEMIAKFAELTCEAALQSENLQNFLLEDNKFDIILTELFNTNCFYGILTKYKSPYIGLSSTYMLSWHASWFGAPVSPSYIPDIYMAYLPPMSFLQRVENTLMHLVNVFWYKVFMEKPGTELSLKYTGYEPADLHNASLLFVNSHYTLHGVRPLPPSIVEVGGMHVVNRKANQLPKNIEKWTNESPSGLIYFSMGSLVKGHSFPENQLKAFLNVFRKLPQRILWKWETETMKDKPDNVMLTKWAPQFDILCHPNTVLFISHGGLLGTTEAVHCGVPTLLLPIFGDQPLNAEAVKSHGAGVKLKWKDAIKKNIKEALEEALSTEKKQNMKALSKRFRDRLVSPLQTAVYWIEYIAKNTGQYLRSPAINMPFYQYFLLDVILFYLVLFSVVVYVSFKLGSKCCARKKNKIKVN